MFTLSWRYLGDIADERFMKKANTSDITQFTLLFPSTSTSCMFTACFLTFAHCSLFNPVVWIVFWFTLSAGSLVGFSFLGQIVWKVGFYFFFRLSFMHLTAVAQFRPNVCASRYVFIFLVFPHLYTYTRILLQLVSSPLENILEISLALVWAPLVRPHHRPHHLLIVYILSWLMGYQDNSTIHWLALV